VELAPQVTRVTCSPAIGLQGLAVYVEIALSLQCVGGGILSFAAEGAEPGLIWFAQCTTGEICLLSLDNVLGPAFDDASRVPESGGPQYIPTIHGVGNMPSTRVIAKPPRKRPPPSALHGSRFAVRDHALGLILLEGLPRAASVWRDGSGL